MDYLRRLLAFRRASIAASPTVAALHRALAIGGLALWVILFGLSARAGAQTVEPPVLPPAVPSVGLPGTPEAPTVPGPDLPGATAPDASGSGGPASVSLQLPDVTGQPSNSVLIIIGLTLLTLAPSLLILTTSFTRIVIVLGLTRNALGLPAIPPNQVVTGLALFLTLFVMGPTLAQMNEVGLQPLLRGEKSTNEALSDAAEPLSGFMLANTRRAELNMIIAASGQERPDRPEDVSLTALIPAYVLSELKTAFIIGFVIFIPFLVIDIAVSSVLMALGMMMLPPAFVALPFKLLLFVMVDGWSLVVESLVRSFN